MSCDVARAMPNALAAIIAPISPPRTRRPGIARSPAGRGPPRRPSSTAPLIDIAIAHGISVACPRSRTFARYQGRTATLMSDSSQAAA